MEQFENVLLMFIVRSFNSSKFCFYHSNTKIDFIKLNIKIFKRMKYTKQRMLNDGCWLKEERNLIEDLF
jgi:hypothetical protein